MVRILILSDVHLGSPAFKHEKEVLHLLSQNWETIIINGDFIDTMGWLTESEIREKYIDILNKLNGKNVVYIKGNHDESLGQFDDYSFILPNGKKVVCLHGHKYDSNNGGSFWVKLNDLIYNVFGFEPRALLTRFVSYEKTIKKALNAYPNADIVIMGHLHRPMYEPLSRYVNVGDMLDHRTYVEITDNDIRLIEII